MSDSMAVSSSEGMAAVVSLSLQCWDEKEEDREEEEEAVGEEEEAEEGSSESEMSSNLEESTSEPELASSERMDECTVDAAHKNAVQQSAPESYDSLVSKGRECFSQGKLDGALDFFLRAIDIKPGDPEVQLMTIKLYRQLSQRS